MTATGTADLEDMRTKNDILQQQITEYEKQIDELQKQIVEAQQKQGQETQ